MAGLARFTPVFTGHRPFGFNMIDGGDDGGDEGVFGGRIDDGPGDECEVLVSFDEFSEIIDGGSDGDLAIDAVVIDAAIACLAVFAGWEGDYDKAPLIALIVSSAIVGDDDRVRGGGLEQNGRHVPFSEERKGSGASECDGMGLGDAGGVARRVRGSHRDDQPLARSVGRGGQREDGAFSDDLVGASRDSDVTCVRREFDLGDAEDVRI